MAAAERLQRLSAQVNGGSARCCSRRRRRLRIAFGEYCEEADSFTKALATRADFEVNAVSQNISNHLETSRNISKHLETSRR
eukprot:SAG31_NODE_4824_length_2925_cov_11.574310_2_plen_82_part_00